MRSYPSGLQMAKEGAALRRTLYPTASARGEAKPHVRRQYRKLLDSGDPAKQAIGFLLLGLAGDLGGRHA